MKAAASACIQFFHKQKAPKGLALRQLERKSEITFAYMNKKPLEGNFNDQQSAGSLRA
jgi:hypothetical protein